MKKLYLGIFIAIFAIIAMSHNASAVDAVFDINDYDLVQQRIYLNQNCHYNDNIINQNVYLCVLNGTRYQLKQLDLAPSANNLEVGDIVQFDLIAYGNAKVFTVGETLGGGYSLPFEYPFLNGSQDYYILGIDELQFESTDTLINYYLQYNCNNLGTGQACAGYPELSNAYKYYQAYRITLKMRVKMINSTLSLVSTTVPILQLNGYNLSNIDVNIRPTRFNVWRPIQTKQEEAAEKEIESTENIENQTPPSSNETGDGAAATNLISAFSGFVSALGGLSATNCNLTLNFPEFAGGSRVVNVCQNKDKAGNIISVFSSLTLIVFYVPLAIRLLTMIYNEIRSFTNG